MSGNPEGAGGTPTVVITGGNRGIGAAIAEAFADAGWAVVVGARTDTGIGGHTSGQVRFHACDVRVPAQLDALGDSAVEWTGRIDCWVNCAGYSAWRPLADVDEAFFDDMIATNLKGTVFGCQTAASRLRAGGSIINISSLAGRRGSANNSVYCVTKFGTTALTQALAKELGAAGIRVNAVCPVYVETEGLLAALRDPRSPASGRPVDEYLAEFATREAALGRLPKAEEVAAACLWLAGPGASAVTGQSLHVDCGVLPW